MEVKVDYSLYLVTDTEMCPREKLFDYVEAAVHGGVTMVQLREKNISTREFYNEAKALKELLRQYKVPLIINDRLDIALAVDADGLHIGQSDLPADITRRVWGEGKILGLSAGTLSEAKAAVRDMADYIGVGAVFHTSTKADAQDIAPETLLEIRENTNVPIIAIGGINEDNVLKLKGSGVDGIAVVSAIMASGDPYGAAHRLKERVAAL